MSYLRVIFSTVGRRERRDWWAYLGSFGDDMFGDD